jgi:DNA modification methylase
MQLFHIRLSEVKYDDSTRQRKTLKGVEELAGSIARIGQLNAIILDKENNLIAGRRRLEALRLLGRETILARYFEALDTSEKRLVELDENLRRVDLSWQENAAAVLELHELQTARSPTWSQGDTAEYCGLSAATVSNSILVGQALRLGDAKVAACGSCGSAADLLRRRRQLDLDSEMEKAFREEGEDLNVEDDLFSSVGEPSTGIYISPDKESTPGDSPRTGAADQGTEGAGSSAAPKHSTKPSPFRIVAGDFMGLSVNPQFSKKFNLLHCDFPYGINFDSSDQGGAKSDDSQYKDSPEVFWGLTKALLQNQDRFVSSSAHMIFWYSLKYHAELVTLLEEFGWFVVPYPLIWHKSCGSGIASDVRRRPKHIYENALFCSRGDRQILTLKNDLYSAPLARKQEAHVSAKPQEMLEYFLSMVVTEHTVLLDPTCGSGTAIRAAAALGAESALGIELNPEVAATSATKLAIYLSQRGSPSVPES